jgi:tRNA(Phe) wybutosine-synthesizing methylase Tyw3
MKPSNFKISPQVSRLSRALQKKGIRNKIEPLNGYKQVGISISWAKLNIKISSRYHLQDPNIPFSEPEANSTSPRNLTSVIKIPNEKVDNNIEELTDYIAKIAWKRYELLKLISQV